MNVIKVLVLTLLLSLLNSIHAQKITVPGTRVNINYNNKQFELSSAYNGFFSKDYQSKINILDRNQAFDTVIEEFSNEALETQGFTIITRFQHPSSLGRDLQALLIKVKKKSLRQWYYFLGNDQSTMMLATFHPEAFDDIVSDIILNKLMSIDYDPSMKLDFCESMNYKIRPSTEFTYLFNDGKTLILTETKPSDINHAAQISVFSQTKPNDYTSLKQWSEANFKNALPAPDLKTHKSKLIKMGDYNTFFISASGTLENEKRYIFFCDVEINDLIITYLGICPLEDRKKFYPEFITTLRSLKPNTPADLPKRNTTQKNIKVKDAFGVEFGTKLDVADNPGDTFQVTVPKAHPLLDTYMVKIGKNSKLIAQVQANKKYNSTNEAEEAFFKLGQELVKKYGYTFTMPFKRAIMYESPDILISMRLIEKQLNLTFIHKETARKAKKE